MKYIIIGAVAGGASTAARLRRMDELAEILIFEKGAYISYANCGLPYYIGDVIKDRNNISENYKSDRVDLSIKTNFKPTFEYTYEKLIPSIIEENKNVFKLKINNTEADDIIACITMFYKDKNPDQVIQIVSGDTDFLQLGRSNVKFINYKSKKYIEIDNTEATKLLNNKIILGDKSDNISSIFPTEKKELSAAKRKDILNDKKLLELYLFENPKIKKKYEVNQQMIDFNFIPKKYYNKIIKEYNEIKY
jgi:5'-3' exonuclease